MNPAVRRVRRATIYQMASLEGTDQQDGEVRRSPAIDEDETLEIPLPSSIPMRHINDSPSQWDLTKLSRLSMDDLLSSLRSRFDSQLIYSFCGDILISINPFHPLPLYGMDVISTYRGARFGDNSPHIYAIAQQAHHDALSSGHNATILISGESGAGKTENTKLLLNFFCSLSSDPSPLEAKLVDCAGFLDLFGNASTVRNRNSSRFGKLVKIFFEKSSGRLVGADLETFLLEVSRVTHQQDGELNFHIFYVFTEGCTQEELERFQMQGRSKAFRIAQNIETFDMNPQDEWKHMEESMLLFGFSRHERNDLMSILAVILHLCQINFIEDDKSHFSMLDEASVNHLRLCAALLKVSMDSLQQCLLSRLLPAVNGQVIKKARSVQDASSTRDSLCKALYGCLFDWIVMKIRKSISPPNDQSAFACIGVLDIFGFENFKVNSLEQLLINFSNEKLHSIFAEHIFNVEQAEYKSEGLHDAIVAYDSTRNVACLEAIEGKTGILSMLDEETRLQAGSDKAFLSKVCSIPSKALSSARLDPTAFVVSHFAEDVNYRSMGFRERNHGSLDDDVLACLKDAQMELVRLYASMGLGRMSSSRTSVSAKFKAQLGLLKRTIEGSKTWFVRCIKSNQGRQALTFDAEFVRRQLVYSGMLEVVQARARGFAFRMTYQELYERFRHIGVSQPTQQAFLRFLAGKKRTMDLFKLGSTKAFFNVDGLKELEQQLAIVQHEKAVRIESVVRMFIARSRFRKSMRALHFIGHNVRIWQRNRSLNLLRKTVTIAIIRAKENRRKFEELVSPARGSPVISKLRVSVGQGSPDATEEFVIATSPRRPIPPLPVDEFDEAPVPPPRTSSSRIGRSSQGRGFAIVRQSSSSPPPPPTMARLSEVLYSAVCISSFQAEGGSEVSVEEGEQVDVLSVKSSGWSKVLKKDGVRGYVPASYLEKIVQDARPAPPPVDLISMIVAGSSSSPPPIPAARREKSTHVPPLRVSSPGRMDRSTSSPGSSGPSSPVRLVSPRRATEARSSESTPALPTLPPVSSPRLRFSDGSNGQSESPQQQQQQQQQPRISPRQMERSRSRPEPVAHLSRSSPSIPYEALVDQTHASPRRSDGTVSPRSQVSPRSNRSQSVRSSMNSQVSPRSAPYQQNSPRRAIPTLEQNGL